MVNGAWAGMPTWFSNKGKFLGVGNNFMTKRGISGGTVHTLPADLRKSLASDSVAREVWEDITPLARNEWICWVISVKKQETRNDHVERVRMELKEGKHRPCCWPGCPHR